MKSLNFDSEYRFYGHRLLYLESRACNRQTWKDVPEHFGRFYPASLTLPSGEVHGSPEGVWFAEQLRQIIVRNPIRYKLLIELPCKQTEIAIFINCLDPVFGHALYKLAASRTLSQQEKNCDIIVIVSSNLAPYANFSAGKVVVNEPLRRLLIPSSNLMPEIMEISLSYKARKWAFCNTSRVGDQQVLPHASRSISGRSKQEKRNLVTFNHRDDRVWGWAQNIQVARVNRVFRSVKKNHQVETVVIGVSNQKLDYNADRNLIFDGYDANYETLLESISRQSLCVFGVHGSHLLVPSYYALTTVELQPSTRLGNAVQAYWPNPGKTIIEALFTYRVLYGDRFLWNVSSKLVARMIGSLILGTPGLLARLDSQVYFGNWPRGSMFKS